MGFWILTHFQILLIISLSPILSDLYTSTVLNMLYFMHLNLYEASLKIFPHCLGKDFQ